MQEMNQNASAAAGKATSRLGIVNEQIFNSADHLSFKTTSAPAPIAPPYLGIRDSLSPVPAATCLQQARPRFGCGKIGQNSTQTRQ